MQAVRRTAAGDTKKRFKTLLLRQLAVLRSSSGMGQKQQAAKDYCTTTAASPAVASVEEEAV